jgi:sigma-B regulation protein RsbU (phosphoserine phosphatase)
MTERHGILDRSVDWRQRLAVIVDTMRDMSLQTEPQAMFRAYRQKIGQLLPIDRSISLSRRGLTRPQYRITRSTSWKEDINPWKEPDRLPLLEGGLLCKLIYGDEPHLIDNLEVSPEDPAHDYLADQRSLMAIPIYDGGVALNMVILLRQEPAAFSREQFPEWVWMSNLFGRAAHGLLLSEQLKEAYTEIDNELKVVGEIQRSLLPGRFPPIPTLDLAASYQTSRRAGGDYYDFFPLPEGRWGIFLADVSGHGTPAAVLMAITHAIAHTYLGPPWPPGQMLQFLNHHLTTRYTVESGTFVTAFYGIYDPAKRELTYACAGHNPPRVRRCQEGTLWTLNNVAGLPLGVAAEETYGEAVQALRPHDQLIFYTDGITEARNPAGEMFGVARLDRVLEMCPDTASELLQAVLEAVDYFAAGRPADDDRTLLVANVS